MNTVNQPIAVKKEAQSKGLETSILFILSPLYTLVSSLRNYHVTRTKNVLWFFIVFFGYTFVISEQIDSFRYRQRLINLSKKELGNAAEFLGLIYQKDSGYVDVVEPLITFTISRFTGDGRILLAFFGLIFGYFYSRNVGYLLSYANGKIKREAIPFLLLAVFVVAIWSLNGFRFWTAAHVFLFGLLRYFNGARIRGALLSISAIFFHFSFALPILVFAVYIITSSRLTVYYFIYFASFFIAQINPEVLLRYSKSIPEIFQERTDTYTNEDYIKVRKKEAKNVNWYIRNRLLAIQYAMNLALLFCYFRYFKMLKGNQEVAGLLCIGLLLFSVTNSLSSVPSVGRFQIVACLLIFSAFYFFVQSMPRKIFPAWVGLPLTAATLLYIVVEIRVGLGVLSPWTVFGNPIIAFFVSNDVPLIDYIK